uniref:Uncharacterized protein n=1 Tax=Romanomermis culicivorax TaxID=13658 RepID=A0A915JMI6_ROMCU
LESYENEVKEHFTNALTIIQGQIQDAQNRYENQYNKRAPNQTFKVGECVLKESEVIKKGLAKKLQPVYLGPYKILKVNYPNLTIQALDNPKHIKTIHVNKTKKYHTNAVLETNAEIQKSKDAIDKPDDRNQKAQCQYNL